MRNRWCLTLMVIDYLDGIDGAEHMVRKFDEIRCHFGGIPSIWR